MTDKSSGAPCACLEPVPCDEPRGVAIWSDCVLVRQRLTSIFGSANEHGAFLLTEPGYIDALDLFLCELSPRDAARCRATPIGPLGRYDAWRSMRAMRMVERSRTPWLPQMLNDENLISYFQPILDLKSGDAIGFEALARAIWDDTLLGAKELIDASRAHRAQHQFDRVARSTAIRCAGRHLRNDELLFVNFSPALIVDPAICFSETWHVLEDSGIPFRNLVFEVVETERYPELGQVRQILDYVRKHGARIALDDLGAGHSSLRYIAELEPDIVKIDRALLPKDHMDTRCQLLSSLTDYAHAHGVPVVAEGIETQTQLDVVTKLGIDYGQGFLLGRPQQTPQRDAYISTKRAA